VLCKKHTTTLSRNLKKIGHLESLDVDSRVLLKSMCRRWDGGMLTEILLAQCRKKG